MRALKIDASFASSRLSAEEHILRALEQALWVIGAPAPPLDSV